jgi:hypothetical protein
VQTLALIWVATLAVVVGLWLSGDVIIREERPSHTHTFHMFLDTSSYSMLLYSLDAEINVSCSHTHVPVGHLGLLGAATVQTALDLAR